jgi:cytochrome c-type biogenesis protein CcmH/NrfG
VLAKTYMQREPAQPDKAIQELQSALKLAPKDVHAVGHLVEAYALKKDAKAAEEALNQLKGLEPKSQRIPVLENLIAEVKAGRPVTLPKEGEPAGH